MTKTRVEAFSDGVVAILITIMVLELKVPHGADLDALRPLLPTFLAYVMSYVYLGIYWNNHQHLLHATSRITGAMLWPNLHLLFWLSLVPFVTSWMGDNPFTPMPTAVYGFILLMAAIAWTILQAVIIRHDGPHSKLKAAVGSDWKGKISALLYIVGIALALVWPPAADAIYLGVALIWLVPDRRIESRLDERPSH
jgi:uncharacterized membrane protein